MKKIAVLISGSGSNLEAIAEACRANRINGKIVCEMGYKVNKNDIVFFDGKKVVSEQKKYVLLNKPKNWQKRQKLSAFQCWKLL